MRRCRTRLSGAVTGQEDAVNESDEGVIYEVMQGENLTLIALRLGFGSHLPIYTHPRNADLKLTRPNPDLLHPGDRIFIPPLRRKEELCCTDAQHTFVAAIPRKRLRITVEDPNGKPVVDVDYALTLQPWARVSNRDQGNLWGSLLTGRTDSSGLIEHQVPVNATRAHLKVGPFTRDIDIGHLNPLQGTPDNAISGIQARLENLGFHPGPIDGIIGPRTAAAIKRFQEKHSPLKVDGVCGPKTLARLKLEHKS
ncbi:MAG: peptidoglycan-binding protein [Bryobacteraceae bacterium]|nr:peptidoglycan-binding protein [Bryobacteraceae bacterium]